MRITCVLGPYLPVPAEMGGAVEKVWQTLCTNFARMGHDVTLISRQYAGFPISETLDGVRHFRVRSTNAPKSKLLYRLFDAIYAARVAVLLPHADVTITNSVTLPLFLPRSRAGKIYVSVARFPKGQIGLYFRADRLQAVSNAVAEAIRVQSPRANSRVRVLPNALSNTFTDRMNRGRIPKNKDIVYAGRIAREKGLDILIRAFLRMPGHHEWTLSFVGPSDESAGGDGARFLAEIERMGKASKGRIRFEPPIFDEEKLAERIEAAEIFVYPSIAVRGESFGMAPLEAMACGCAVVVSNLECFSDFVIAGKNAMTFNHNDATGEELASVLLYLINRPELRADLATAAIETAQSFRARRVAELFVRDFVELTS